jgi:hypothetical protein
MKAISVCRVSAIRCTAFTLSFWRLNGTSSVPEPQARRIIALDHDRFLQCAIIFVVAALAITIRRPVVNR